MSKLFPVPQTHETVKTMMFIDGENLAIRYKDILGSSERQEHVYYEKDIYVWTRFANIRFDLCCNVIRRYYYTCVQGDDIKCERIHDELKQIDIEIPRVYKKEKNKKSKRVDIALSTDMLSHAHRNNYDAAILIAGDQDYIPLVEAVMAEGKQVILWFFNTGLHPALRRAVDHYYDLSEWFFNSKQSLEDNGYRHL